MKIESEGLARPLSLDIATLRTLTGYAHWIPVLGGYYQEYFKKNFPGWEWNQIIPELHKAKVITRTPENANYRQLRMGLFISREITTVLISVEDGKVRVVAQSAKVLRKVK